MANHYMTHYVFVNKRWILTCHDFRFTDRELGGVSCDADEAWKVCVRFRNNASATVSTRCKILVSPTNAGSLLANAR